MRAGLAQIRLRYREDIPVDGVEALCDIPRDLQMLQLILADRNHVCLIEQDIGGHQYRIGKQPRIDVIRMFGRLVLKLRHAVQFSHIGKTVQDP